MNIDRRSIIEFLDKRADRPLKPKEIARPLGVESHEYSQFRDLLREMERSGELYRVRKGRYALPKRINLVVGRLQTTRAGHGFVVPDDDQVDVFVPASRLGSAFDGDRVVARIERKRGRDRNPEGTVVRVLARGRSQVVGVYRRSGRYGFLVPEDPKLRRDLFIPPTAALGAEDGEVVVARVADWGSDQLNPVGEVTEVLGPPEKPGVDVLAIVHDHELAIDFPPEVVADAERLSDQVLTERDLEGRVDFRDLLTLTIDPADAKDHDDAVSIEEAGEGLWRVGVHIADVSHFVREGSPLDREAHQRGTSVYLVDRVLPMLPHALSGDLCSLKPGEDRLTLSVLLELTGDGEVRSTKPVAGVIRSSWKLSYEEAQDIIDGRRSTDPEVSTALRQLQDLTQHLRRARQARGGLDFDLPEARIVLNSAGEPTEIRQILRLSSHQLIEELMILANEQIARLARERRIPFIYRIHEPPDPLRIEQVRDFVAGLGLRLAKDAHRSPRGLQKLLSTVDDRPEEGIVSTLVLRSLKQARYSAEQKGHFGLGADAYTHFTSPIRRYPDLVVHRLFRQAFLAGGAIPPSTVERLPAVAEHSSVQERRAMEAERDSVDLKKIEFMERHIGDVFEGTISGVTSYGLFVLLDNVLVEGLVHVSLLEDDYYHLHEEQHALVGESHGRRFRLGDRLGVRVIAVNRTTRELDLDLAE